MPEDDTNAGNHVESESRSVSAERSKGDVRCVCTIPGRPKGIRRAGFGTITNVFDVDKSENSNQDAGFAFDREEASCSNRASFNLRFV